MRISDWTSDVCSSDLHTAIGPSGPSTQPQPSRAASSASVSAATVRQPSARRLAASAGSWQGGRKIDRKSVVLGKGVSVRVDLGGSHILKKTKIKHDTPERILSSRSLIHNTTLT